MNADKLQRIATVRDAGLCFSCDQAGIMLDDKACTE